jgi:hypothetical protein
MKIAAGGRRRLKKTRYCRKSFLTYNILCDSLFSFFAILRVARKSSLLFEPFSTYYTTSLLNSTGNF